MARKYQYPSFIRKQANEWASALFTKNDWKEDPNRHQKPGEAGGFIVITGNVLNAAYLKPTNKSHEHHPRAANEKIASDLAFHLGVAVPPVLLYRRKNCPPKAEPNVCLSLILYPEQWEWDQLAKMKDFAKALARKELALNSGIIAFDCFIGNTDRNNSRNALFGMNSKYPAEDGLLFLDLANSLNHNKKWGKDKWKDVKYPPMFTPMKDSADWFVIDSTISRIEKLPDNLIKKTVDRIPNDFMTNETKKIVVDGLLGRRMLIRKVISDQHSF